MDPHLLPTPCVAVVAAISQLEAVQGSVEKQQAMAAWLVGYGATTAEDVCDTLDNGRAYGQAVEYGKQHGVLPIAWVRLDKALRRAA